MTKKQFYLLFSVIIVLVLIISNPNEENHIESVKNKLKIAFKKKMSSEIVDNNSDSMESLGKGIGLLLGDTFIDKMADGFISRENYFLFSTTKAEYKGETKTIGFGILGNIFITDKIDQLFEDKNELTTETNSSNDTTNSNNENEISTENIEPKIDFNSLNWKTINSDRYNYSIELPSIFDDLGLRESLFVKYYSKELDDLNIMIEPYGEINDKLFQEEYNTQIQDAKNIVYKTFNKNFFALSGTNEEFIYYTKCIKKGDQIYYLNISYPENKKSEYNKITARISNSFK